MLQFKVAQCLNFRFGKSGSAAIKPASALPFTALLPIVIIISIQVNAVDERVELAVVVIVAQVLSPPGKLALVFQDVLITVRIDQGHEPNVQTIDQTSMARARLVVHQQ